MWLLKINRNIRLTFRFIHILFIIIGHGIKNWFHASTLRKIFDPKGKSRISRNVRYRLLIEDLGPTFVKFGQILADRPDIIEEALCHELKKLQNSARPFDDDEAIEILERELGDNVNKIFKEINRQHIASASIGQVYRGILITGEEVIIKVQRPGIKKVIERDLKLMSVIAQKFQGVNPQMNSFNLVKFIETFSEIMLKELDYKNEVSNMLRFTNIFRDDPRCYIPKVYTKYCTNKVLVMEYIDGYTPNSVSLLKAKGFSTQKIAENGVHIILTMILKNGFFHADPHPGNLFIRGNNQIVMIDHGMCGTLKPKQIDGLIDFLMGFSEKNSRKITRSLLILTETKEVKNLEDIEFEINEIIKTYSIMSFKEIDIASVFNDVFKVLSKYGILIPANLYMIIKTIATIQNFAEQLGAKISLPSMIKPYAREKILEHYNVNKLKMGIFDLLSDYTYYLKSFPKDMREIVTAIKNEKTNSQSNLVQSKSAALNFAPIIVVALMLFCSTLLIASEIESGFISFFFVFSVILAAIVLLKTLFNKNS